MTTRTRYLTVDLVVKGDLATDQLRTFLEARDYPVQRLDGIDGHKWCLNISCPRDYGEAESCIRQYCRDLAALPDEARKEWEQARYREFFIGYHVGREPRCFENHLSADTVATVSDLGAGIGIALYPDPDGEE